MTPALTYSFSHHPLGLEENLIELPDKNLADTTVGWDQLSQLRHRSSIRLNNLLIIIYHMGGLDCKAGHNYLPAFEVHEALQV